MPHEEVVNYLAARYDDRLKVHPRKFEEVVAAVFRGLGYQTRVTSYSCDGGIDVFMDGPDNVFIGVQVKRSRNSISVGQIRELTGALVLQGVTRGIFVTTSHFTAAARKEAGLAALRGIPVELVDAYKLFDALKIGRIKSYQSARFDPPWREFKEYLARCVEEEIRSRHEIRATRTGGNNTLLETTDSMLDEEDEILIRRLRA